MGFITKVTALVIAAAIAVSANSVTFLNQDSTARTIKFTPSTGHGPVASVKVEGHGSKKVTIPQSWIGNWYSISDGAKDVPGMLGEVTFQGWNDLTYFDVSAIVNPNDHVGVKELYPVSQANSLVKTLVSGCLVFPCGTAYYLPDDIQTVTTKETDLICTLGSSTSTTKRSKALVGRHFVLAQS